MAGTVTFVHIPPQPTVGRIVATCIADASDGSYPDAVLPAFEGRLLAVRTNPGTTGPTDNYDITLIDGDGVDRIQGVGANRSITSSQEAAVVYPGTAIHPPVSLGEALTQKIGGNSVASAVTVVTYVYTPSM